MSTFRRIDSLLDGKTSDQLASEVAARARERAEEDQRIAQLADAGPPAASWEWSSSSQSRREQ